MNSQVHELKLMNSKFMNLTNSGFIPDRENRENRENEKCQGNVRELFFFPYVREMSGNFF